MTAPKSLRAKKKKLFLTKKERGWTLVGKAIMAIKLRDELENRAKVRPIVLEISEEIRCMLPFARIDEVGSTAIPGAITKGDIDLAVFVAEEQFDSARDLLREIYQVNEMGKIEQFASFKGVRGGVDFGIQLCCSDELFGFVEFRDLLRESKKLVAQYNQVKLFASSLTMDEFRVKKNEFIESVLQKK